MDWTFGWTAVGAIATLLLFGGVVAAILQMREAKRNTSAQVAVSLLKELRDERMIDILIELYQQSPDRIIGLVDSTDEEDLKLEKGIASVLDKLELLGGLVSQGIVDKGIAIAVYGGPPALRCWYVLGEYIKTIRTQKRGSLYCQYVEDFAALTWENCFRKGATIYFYTTKNTPSINLIKYFEDNPDKGPKRYESIDL